MKAKNVCLLIFVSIWIISTSAFAGNVGTADIVDGAITTPKLADGAVTNLKINDNAVTITKIADGNITASKIADGAVTDAKISGQISASKISSAGLDADSVDGKHASDFAPAGHGHLISDVNGLEASLAGKSDIGHSHNDLQKKYKNLVVVAKDGGDFANPMNAINSITDASAENPYLVLIMPGIYDMGGSVLITKPFVDIKGSGQKVTKIIGKIQSGGNCVISSLAVENFSDGLTYGDVEGIEVQGDTIISHVAVKVGGALGHNLSIAILQGQPIIEDVVSEVIGNQSIAGQKGWGIYIMSPGSAVISDVHAKVVDCQEGHGIGIVNGAMNVTLTNVYSESIGAYEGEGILVQDGQFIAKNCTFVGKHGIIVSGSGASGLITNSSLTGTTRAIYNASELKIANSLLEGIIYNDGNAVLKLFNVYNQNLDTITY